VITPKLTSESALIRALSAALAWATVETIEQIAPRAASFNRRRATGPAGRQ
jgi:hypothetical protein